MNNQVNESNEIARFWRRLAAFLVDCLILGLIGWGIGLIFTELLVKLGPWARLLGFLIALTYFGTFNSTLGNGQTLGKRLFRIKVVNRNNEVLSVGRAFARFIPLAIPWFLNNAQLPESALFSFWIYPLSVAIFGIGFSIIYLYIFNRRSRQSLHDLLVGSYVVKADATQSIGVSPPWRTHLIVCGLLIIASAIVPYFTKELSKGEPFSSLVKIFHTVSAEPWVTHAQVNRGTTYISESGNGKRQATYLSITAFTDERDIENADRANQLAKAALASDSSLKSVNVIQVTVVRGYDIGIASSWQSHSFNYAPGEMK